MIKKIFAMILSLAVIFSMTPMVEIVSAAEIASGDCGEHVTWSLNDQGTLTIAGTGPMADYMIKEGNKGYTEQERPYEKFADRITSIEIEEGVTSIGMGAFFHLSHVGSAVIAGSVEKIGDCAFEMDSVKSIKLENGIQVIGNSAFARCDNLKDISIPDSVTSIGDFAFLWDASLETAKIGNSVVTIGDSAFMGCSRLSSIHIPASVNDIKGQAFASCTGLKTFDIDPKGNYLISDGVVFSKDGKNLLLCIVPVKGAYTVPDGVENILGGAFSENGQLTQVILPDSVKSIGAFAFCKCSSLQSLLLNEGLLSIEDGAFFGCSSLKEVTFKGDAPVFQGNNSIGISGESSVIVNYDCAKKGWTDELFEKFPESFVTNHEIAPDSRKADCTEPGYSGIYKCSKCNTFFEDAEGKEKIRDFDQWIKENGVPALGHNLTHMVDEEGSCIADRLESDHCSRCNQQLNKVVTPAPGHKFSGWRIEKAPTCDQKGVKSRICEICGEDEYVRTKALGHEEIVDQAITPTCTESGLTEGKHCEACGKVLVKQEIVPALGHTWEKERVIEDSTCTASGICRHTCSICKVTQDDTIPAKGHKWNQGKVIKGADCTTIGMKEYSCTICDSQKTEEIPMLSHKYSSVWTTDVEPTYSVKGSKSHHCTVCGKQKDITDIPMKSLLSPKVKSVKIDEKYNAVKVTWGKVNGANAYVASYRIDAGSQWKTKKVDEESASFTGLRSGSKYQFKIQAVAKNSSGKIVNIGEYSKSRSIRTLKKMDMPDITKYSSGKVKVKWEKMDGATGYQISRSDSAEQNNVISFVKSVKSVSKIVKAKKDVICYYKVRAYRYVDGKRVYAPWSEAKSFQVK